MSVLGLITEYNPFHNGHLYHLENSKEITGCDTVVCIMSGNFIQRGQPALINKWARAKMALNNKVDMVIELPVHYSVSSAEFFAYGAIKLLDSLGIVDYVCFGSEYGNTDTLGSIAEVLVKEPDSFKKNLSEYLGKGLSFPAARSLALQDYFKQANHDDYEVIKSVIIQPNNILGVEYIKALLKLKSNIKPITIKRFKADYNSYIRFGNIASATAIRKMLKSDDLHVIKAVVPPSTYEILNCELSEGRGPVFLESFESAILSTIRRMNLCELERIFDVEEGMENRIKKTSQQTGTLPEFLHALKTKRYTLTRLQRILIRILLGLTKESFDTFNLVGGPQYIRVLGFSKKGEELLSKIKSSSPLPLVTSPSDFLHKCNPLQKSMLNADILASDIYCLGYPSPSQRTARQDFFQPILTHL